MASWVAKVSSPKRSGWEISDSAAPVTAAMTVRAAVPAETRNWPRAAPSSNRSWSIRYASRTARAAGGDGRRPHQLVEVRVLARELEVVVPARSDIVGDLLVHDDRDLALRLQELRPAEVDPGRQKPFLVAEMVIERRRVTPAASQTARVDASARRTGRAGRRRLRGCGF
jgi:hypothetical protein